MSVMSGTATYSPIAALRDLREFAFRQALQREQINARQKLADQQAALGASSQAASLLGSFAQQQNQFAHQRDMFGRESDFRREMFGNEADLRREMFGNEADLRRELQQAGLAAQSERQQSEQRFRKAQSLQQFAQGIGFGSYSEMEKAAEKAGGMEKLLDSKRKEIAEYTSNLKIREATARYHAQAEAEMQAYRNKIAIDTTGYGWNEVSDIARTHQMDPYALLKGVRRGTMEIVPGDTAKANLALRRAFDVLHSDEYDKNEKSRLFMNGIEQAKQHRARRIQLLDPAATFQRNVDETTAIRPTPDGGWMVYSKSKNGDAQPSKYIEPPERQAAELPQPASAFQAEASIRNMIARGELDEAKVGRLYDDGVQAYYNMQKVWNDSVKARMDTALSDAEKARIAEEFKSIDPAEAHKWGVNRKHEVLFGVRDLPNYTTQEAAAGAKAILDRISGPASQATQGGGPPAEAQGQPATSAATPASSARLPGGGTGEITQLFASDPMIQSEFKRTGGDLRLANETAIMKKYRTFYLQSIGIPRGQEIPIEVRRKLADEALKLMQMDGWNVGIAE
jgi:hypothetical protein